MPGPQALGQPVIEDHIDRGGQVHAALGRDIDHLLHRREAGGIQGAILGAEDVEGTFRVDIIRQRCGPLDKIHQHRGASGRHKVQQRLDPEQGDLVHHLLGIGSKTACQLEAVARVVDLVRPVATGGTHHGPHVLR